MWFTPLLHHLAFGLPREGFYRLKRRAARGVDGVTWEEYESGLEGWFVDLHSRVHRSAYRSQPSKRVYIPKSDGRRRPLGIAAREDKIVQHAKDPMTTASAIDQLVHHSVILEPNIGSYRMEKAKKRKGRTNEEQEL